MANKQTKWLRKLGLGTKVVKGAAVPKEQYKNDPIGQCLNYVQIPDPPLACKRRSPWRGCGQVRKSSVRDKSSLVKIYKDVD